jgi:hypothetical protein
MGQKNIPAIGGFLCICILPSDQSSVKNCGKPSSRQILSDLQQTSQLESNRRASDTVEKHHVMVSWHPGEGVLSVDVMADIRTLVESQISIVSTF